MIERRRYLELIEPFIDVDLIKVLVGVRRSGKTVLLGQIRDRIIARGVDPEQTITLNFESYANRQYRSADALYEYVISQAKKTPGRTYIFLDEIQNVPDWQEVVNSFRVDLDCDIYVTGSNSKLLSGELATLLSGRYVQIRIMPFSFREVCELEQSLGRFTTNEQAFQDYLSYGGFPQRLAFTDEHSVTTYLLDLYSTIILQDVINRHAIRDVGMLRRVLEFVLDNVGNPFSARKIAGYMTSQGMKVNVQTVLNYLEYFQEAFAIYGASRYDLKGKEILSSTEKYYAVDLGLRNVVKKSETKDVSKLYENAVYLEMRSRGYDVYVGKLGAQEIDFVCTRGKEKLYIQAAYLINSKDQEREFGNLEKIEDNYPKYVVSSDLVDMSRNGIIHKNIIDFLLGR